MINAPYNWIFRKYNGACASVIEKLNLIMGSGFNTAYHSLIEIAEKLGLKVPPTPIPSLELEHYTCESYGKYECENFINYTIGDF